MEEFSHTLRLTHRRLPGNIKFHSSMRLLSIALLVALNIAMPLAAQDPPVDLTKPQSPKLHFKVQVLLLPKSKNPDPLRPGQIAQIEHWSKVTFTTARALPEAIPFHPVELDLEPDTPGSALLKPTRSNADITPLHLTLIHRDAYLALTIVKQVKPTGKIKSKSNPSPPTPLEPFFLSCSRFSDSSPMVISATPSSAPNIELHLLIEPALQIPDSDATIPTLKLNRANSHQTFVAFRNALHNAQPSVAAPNYVFDYPLIREQRASVSIDLTDVPALEALRYISEIVGCQPIFQRHAVLIQPIMQVEYELLRKSYTLPAPLTAQIQAQSPEMWLKHCDPEFRNDLNDPPPSIDPQTNTLSLRCMELDAIRLDLLFRLLGAHPAPAPLPKIALQAQKLILPTITLHACSLDSALIDLHKHLDATHPKKTLPNFTALPHAVADYNSPPTISLDLHQIPLLDVLRYIALQTRTRLIAKDNTLVFVPFFYFQQNQ
jgi:hypothetical protein